MHSGNLDENRVTVRQGVIQQNRREHETMKHSTGAVYKSLLRSNLSIDLSHPHNQSFVYNFVGTTPVNQHYQDQYRASPSSGPRCSQRGAFRKVEPLSSNQFIHISPGTAAEDHPTGFVPIPEVPMTTQELERYGETQ